MNLDLFKKTKRTTQKKGYLSIRGNGPKVPRGLLRKCNKCGSAIIAEDAIENYYICPKCGGYFRVDAYSRIARIADEGSFEEWDRGLAGGNPMNYRGYEEKVAALKEKTGLDEAVVTGSARIDGRRVVLGVCDGRFLMASMGEVVGEKITRAVERATKEKLPVILVACSGGARMQEGIISLMQMAKTAAALKRHSDAGALYVSVLTDPTTGGVTASFAMLGDVILAEPKALIGFAGPRVIEQTIGQKLPKGFQRAEFLLEHGFVDQIVERADLRDTLSTIVRLHENAAIPVQQDVSAQEKNVTEPGSGSPAADRTGAQEKGSEAPEGESPAADRTGAQERNVTASESGSPAADRTAAQEIGSEAPEGESPAADRTGAQEMGSEAPESGSPAADRTGAQEKGSEASGSGSPAADGTSAQERGGAAQDGETPMRAANAWERVQLSRRNDRPVGNDYIHALFDDFTELHGDRCFADDRAVVGGIASFHGMPVTVIAQEKGTNTKENIERNFGMPSPDGYRKAVRLMRQAEKFHRPVICFVDTPGAFCGIEAEERGQGEAIARSIYEMSALRTPVLSVMIGEGGSGGALAMATADEVWMLENSVYSILSPEGFASILWKDSTKAKDAAALMKLTAQELKMQGVIDLVFSEPEHYTAANMSGVTERLDRELGRFLKQYTAYGEQELTERRYGRFRTL